MTSDEVVTPDPETFATDVGIEGSPVDPADDVNGLPCGEFRKGLEPEPEAPVGVGVGVLPPVTDESFFIPVGVAFADCGAPVSCPSTFASTASCAELSVLVVTGAFPETPENCLESPGPSDLEAMMDSAALVTAAPKAC